MAQIGFSIELDEVSHTVVKRIPEVPKASALSRWHAEVMSVSCKVCLTWHAYADVVVDMVYIIRVSAVVTVCLVVPRPNHIRLLESYGSHLIIKRIQDAFVNFVTCLNGGIGEETLYLFLEPIVGIRNVPD